MSFKNFLRNPLQLALWGLILLGLLLRLRQYRLRLALWLDEAMLALNLVQRDFSQLIQPLDYDQGAPLGFLFALKSLITAFGTSEHVFRLLPLVAGSLSLVLIYLLGKKLTGPAGSLFVVGILALGSYYISYSVMVKQYALDLALALLLTWLALPFFDGQATPKRFAGLALAGITALWFSHPALFVLGGIGLALAFYFLLQKDQGRLMASLGLGIAWLLNFGLLYRVQFEGLAANDALIQYWREYFLPLDASAPGWALGAFLGNLHNPIGLADNLLWPALGLFGVGLLAAWRQNRPWLSLLAFTTLLVFAASALQKYPFGGRMGLFFSPFVALTVGMGLDQLGLWLKRLHPRAGWASLALTGVLLVSPALQAAENFINPRLFEHITPTMTYLAKVRQPGDSIYVYPGAVPAFRFYAEQYGFEEDEYVAGTGYGVEIEHYMQEIDQFRGQPRVWVLFSHVFENKGVDEQAYLVEYLGDIGAKRDEFRLVGAGTGVTLYLYDLSER